MTAFSAKKRDVSWAILNKKDIKYCYSVFYRLPSKIYDIAIDLLYLPQKLSLLFSEQIPMLMVKKLFLCISVLLVQSVLFAQLPNHYFYFKSVFDNEPYKFSFMDVSSTDTVVVSHRTGFSGSRTNDTVVGNYVMITPSLFFSDVFYYDVEDWCVISINGQQPLCSERLELQFYATPQPEVNLTDSLCLRINDTMECGSLSHFVYIVNMDSGTVEGTYDWNNEFPIQVCGLPSGSYIIAFRYVLNDLEYKKNISVIIP